MTGEQSLLAILGVAALAAGSYIWKARLNNASAIRKLDTEAKIKMDAEGTERNGIANDLASKHTLIQVFQDGLQATQNAFLKLSW